MILVGNKTDLRGDQALIKELAKSDQVFEIFGKELTRKISPDPVILEKFPKKYFNLNIAPFKLSCRYP